MDSIETAFDTLANKLGVYGTAIVTLVVMGLGIWLGARYLWRSIGRNGA